MTTAEEKWREKPPSAWTFRLLVALAVVVLVPGLIWDSWWKGVAVGVALLCGNLAIIAWKARRRAISN